MTWKNFIHSIGNTIDSVLQEPIKLLGKAESTTVAAVMPVVNTASSLVSNVVGTVANTVDNVASSGFGAAEGTVSALGGDASNTLKMPLIIGAAGLVLFMLMKQ